MIYLRLDSSCYLLVYIHAILPPLPHPPTPAPYL